MRKYSEQRARRTAIELLELRGWNTAAVMNGGQLLEEGEYKRYQNLESFFSTASKTGESYGRPDFLLLDSHLGLRPIIIIETKSNYNKIDEAISDAIHYGEFCRAKNVDVICVGIAGSNEELFSIRVCKYVKGQWIELTLNGQKIDWIPSCTQAMRILADKDNFEIKPEMPTKNALNNYATLMNEILRECKIKDEFRPIIAATFMLALWKGDVSVDKSTVLSQVNSNVELALRKAYKPELAQSLRVDVENEMLAARAWEIIDILKKLNIRSFENEHDYLGQLYETFFRYTGGNTIGQYFTPRHIISFICELVDLGKEDVVFDPACGTGGFLIGALNEMIKKNNLPYEDAIGLLKDNLFGMESEPGTAALCITNMILRGDGKSGILKADCFTQPDYPNKPVDFVLMNPPFPHKKTDAPATDFIDRGLSSLKKRGVLVSVVPYSLLVKTTGWHKKILEDNTLMFAATLPSDLFAPYASYNTAIIMLQKSVPHENKKVFFGRVTNDGYKTKKNARIEQGGGQLNDLRENFFGKKESDRFCTHKALGTHKALENNASEWAPEAFLDSCEAMDQDFIDDFEAFMRKHAAFYISAGWRVSNSLEDSAPSTITLDVFKSNSKLCLNEIPTNEFCVQDYFDVILGGKDEIEDLPDGKVPFVSTSEFMNGVTSWKSPNIIYKSPSITIATDGSTCSSFVQEFSFYAFYKVAIVKPKPSVCIPVDALYFIAYMFTREKWKYVYARKFGKNRIMSTMLKLPSKNGRPDFEVMAQIVQKSLPYPVIDAFRASKN